MSPYQRTLQMYCTFISSKECAKSCFSKTLHAPAKTILRKQFVSFDGGTTNLPPHASHGSVVGSSPVLEPAASFERFS
jgi:hypothetical protein